MAELKVGGAVPDMNAIDNKNLNTEAVKVAEFTGKIPLFTHSSEKGIMTIKDKKPSIFVNADRLKAAKAAANASNKTTYDLPIKIVAQTADDSKGETWNAEHGCIMRADSKTYVREFKGANGKTYHAITIMYKNGKVCTRTEEQPAAGGST